MRGSGDRGVLDFRPHRRSRHTAKDFKESDRIRDELAAMGVVLKDGKDAAGNHVHHLGGRAIMGQALPKPALRPFLAADVPILAAIFVAAIEELTGDDYSEAQQEAWAASVDDEEQFGEQLAGQLTLIATMQNSPVGFASLKGPDHIEMLYVHPSVAGQGVASMLCDALEKLAGGRGAKNLTVDASDTAVDFFTKRGYVAKQRNTVTVNGEWLANTTMQKALADNAAPGAPS